MDTRYIEDGAQITPPHDTGIMAEVKKSQIMRPLRRWTKMPQLQQVFIRLIGADIDDPYIEELKN